GERGVVAAAAGEPLVRREGGLAVPQQQERGGGAGGVAPAGGGTGGLSGERRRLRVAAGGCRGRAPGGAVGPGVHGLVGEAVGVAVALARDPREVDGARRDDGLALKRQRTHGRVLDLPAAGNLLHDEPGVHAVENGGVGVDVVGG